MGKRKLSIVLLVLVVSSNSRVNAEQYPPAVANFLTPEMAVLRQFDAPAGMTGYLVSTAGTLNVFYLSPDQSHVIVGTMFGPTGINMTSEHLAKFVPKQTHNAHWMELERTAWIAEGAQAPKSIVYVIADPDCPYCQVLRKASQPYQKAGLQLRWLLISSVFPDGENKAAAILEAPDPAAALRRHARVYQSGGVASVATPRPETREKLDVNRQLASELGAFGTPTLIFKDAVGIVHVLVGLPKLAMLPDIFQLPIQPQTDPSLQWYR